ncbi:AAA domain-containing protein [Tsukamurella paurometabola]|uniref:DNA helicase n=1 Tax=Tsukamurella paurometabola (strain ATCC 8368 / DSM 20162 / CCUG 35730 / CIP 100753 / JCM 10117 / KCTC 9821 / NBRC 16120 / NCIMB 702349 / NCTC 13040) TaxID=521096 RepID=D5UWR3_TSUPD|nr:AAA domain-containing protein [Tsukamurella paurometabola]ADG77935.1 DNA helicase [Tsukamurella paurometabola DSM 20162]SUP29428.1 exonuclease V subunit alpha [Tsukamurella paurometabola]
MTAADEQGDGPGGRRDRVVRLLQYLDELIRSRSVVARDLDDHLAVLPLTGDGALTESWDADTKPGGTIFTVPRQTADGPDSPHSRLLRVFDELTDHPESVELVLASGLLTARDGDTRIRAHLLTQPVLLERDRRGRKLSVVLPRDSVPRVEDSLLLAGLPSFDLSGSAELQDELRESVRTVLDPACEEFTEKWLGAASRDGGAHIDFAPALVLRTRGSAPLLGFYDAMKADVSDPGRTVPVGLAQLVEAVDADERLAMLDEIGAISPAELLDEAYYVLPSNVEQRDILAHMGGDTGVVVEGPPGTGKTHTIANLLAALLAKGQRVLVVSEKAQALAVLEDKLPPELRQLVVSVTDVTKDGSASLAASVTEIATRKSTYSEALADAELRDLRAKRDRAIDRREDLLREVWSLRTAETEDSDFLSTTYAGKPADVVAQVRRDADEYSWLPGPIDGTVPPLDTREFGRLVDLLRRNDDLFSRRLAHSLPDLSAEVPDVDDLEQLTATLADSPLAESVDGEGALAHVLGGVDADQLSVIKARADIITELIDRVRRFPPSAQLLAEDMLIGTRAHLASRLVGLEDQIAIARAADVELDGAAVELSDTPDANDRAAIERYARFLADGNEPRKRFRKPEQKAFEQTGLGIVVDGDEGADRDFLLAAERHLVVEDAIGRVATVLAALGLEAPVADPTGNGSARGRSERLSQAADQLLRARTVVRLVGERDRMVQAMQRLSENSPRPKDLDEVESVAEQVVAISAAAGAREAYSRLDTVRLRVQEIVERGPSPEGDALVAALRQYRYGPIRDARRAWDAARTERDDRGALDLLALRLRTKAPALFDLMARTADDPVWDTRVPEMTKAWSWRRAVMWAAARVHPADDAQLEADLQAAEQDVAHYTTRIATASAWRQCLRRMTFEEIQALHAYRDHVASIGRGSGRHAERFRVAAREAMRQAQSAVPAWIMPISQVVASISPEPNAFDVVIVDEASQADITSSFLLWLAPRVIVVGDENQCAPSAFTGISLDDVFARLDAQLPDIPPYLRDSLTPRSSLFTLLRTRFGHTVRLREHFRCMPEIIDFSSLQFYSDAPLIPVRHYGADRPVPLRVTHVDDAEVVGEGARISNPREAQAIVDQLVACFADPAYTGRTFGVIALQGQGQVDELYRRLRAAIDPDEWDARRLRVGTPPDFQGDERDVVMLSMVVAPDYRFRALTGRDFQRRFNVAASRARDQLWLFTSVGEDDLKPNDLRASLLRYVTRADVEVAQPMPADVPTDRRVEPFDNLFEQQVFVRLRDMGYHVNPKVTVNNRVIDLVVTGENGRLAVECDGADFASTPEQARSDIERERELRRCGWEFVRVRESVFLTDPDAAMAVVLQALDRRGVQPLTLQRALTVGEKATDGSVEVWEPVGLDIDTE